VAYEKQKRPQQSRTARSPPHTVPPTPELVKYSGTHMVFKPSQFIPESGAEVSATCESSTWCDVMHLL